MCIEPKDRKKHDKISDELDRQLRDNCFYYTTRPSWLLNPCASYLLIVASLLIFIPMGLMIYLMEKESDRARRLALQGAIYFMIELNIMAGVVAFFHIRMVRELSASSVKAYYISAFALQVISFIVILSIGWSYWKGYSESWWLYTLVFPLALVLGAIQEWSRYSVLMKLLEDYDAEEGAFARKPDQTVVEVHQPMVGYTDQQPAHVGLPISQQPVLQQPHRATCEFHESQPQVGRQLHETQANTSLAQHHSHPSQ